MWSLNPVKESQMKKLFWLAAFASAALIPGLSQTPAGDAANGKRLFLRDGC